MNGDWALDPSARAKPENNIRYPNTSIEDIITTLGEKVNRVHHERQKIIDDISKYIDSVLENLPDIREGNTLNKHTQLINKKGEPLGGIRFFDKYGPPHITNPVNFLIGAYIGGCLDNAEWRTKTEERFGISMHKGVCCAVNLEAAQEKGYTLNSLASLGGKGVSLGDLSKRGIISTNPSEKYSDGFVSGFIELQKGAGVSDDAALISVGLQYGLEAAYGFLLMDAIDTWDKATPYITFGGQDERIGSRIKKDYESLFGANSFPCSDDEVTNIIYLSAIDSSNQGYFPSCSQRRFVEVNKQTGLCAIQSHVAFINIVKQGGYFPPTMKLAFKQVPSDMFYKAFREKYDKMSETGKLRNSAPLPYLNGCDKK